MTTVVTRLITSGTTFTIPADFVSLVSIEAIGSGGGAAGGPGGGGGAYAKSTSATGLSANGTAYISVGLGVDTWLNTTTNAVPTLASQGVLAKAGLSGSGSTGGLGGNSAQCVGDVVYSGGNGGTYILPGRGGGGGAGGPGGVGGAAGDGLSQGGGGGGGGGAGLTSAGSAGSVGSSPNGGMGGNGGGGSGGGSGGTTGYGNPGTAGTGGGGGGTVWAASVTSSVGMNTATGATGSIWIESGSGVTAGPGGGGGGGSNAGPYGSNGGFYGGGRGGGATYPITSATPAPGIIVFKYNAGPTYITATSGVTITGGVKFTN